VKIFIAALTLQHCIPTLKHRSKNTELAAFAPLYLKPLPTLRLCERDIFLSRFKLLAIIGGAKVVAFRLKNEVAYV
jgi:hypothetical protein